MKTYSTLIAAAISMAVANVAIADEQTMTFEGLDTDGNGYISSEEASVREDITSNWKDADADGNGSLNSSEFSAFEGAGQYTPPEDSEISEPGAAPY